MDLALDVPVPLLSSASAPASRYEEENVQLGAWLWSLQTADQGKHAEEDRPAVSSGRRTARIMLEAGGSASLIATEQASEPAPTARFELLTLVLQS